MEKKPQEYKGLQERAGNEELEVKVEKQESKAVTHKTGSLAATVSSEVSRLGTAGSGKHPSALCGPT